MVDDALLKIMPVQVFFFGGRSGDGCVSVHIVLSPASLRILEGPLQAMDVGVRGYKPGCCVMCAIIFLPQKHVKSRLNEGCVRRAYHTAI